MILTNSYKDVLVSKTIEKDGTITETTVSTMLFVPLLENRTKTTLDPNSEIRKQGQFSIPAITFSFVLLF